MAKITLTKIQGQGQIAAKIQYSSVLIYCLVVCMLFFVSYGCKLILDPLKREKRLTIIIKSKQHGVYLV